MGQKDFDLTPFTFTIALGACTPEVKIWFEFNHGQDSLQKTTVHPIEDRGLIQTHQHGFSVDFLNDHANQMKVILDCLTLYSTSLLSDTR